METEDKENASQQQPKRIKKLKSSEALKDHQSVHILSTDIAIEILLRLPVECLLRCKSVCKSWYTLISEPHFVKSHLSLSTSNNHYAHHRLIFRPVGGVSLNTCPLYDVLYDRSINVLELNHPGKHLREAACIVGSCNGLVCMSVLRNNMFIWNPSTRRSTRLPYCGKACLCGFGYDESSDDYKVVAMSIKDNNTKVNIYSLKSGKWKNIDDFPGIPTACSTFSNGALHWVATSTLDSSYTRTIVSLDLVTETYDKVKQPVYAKGYEGFTIGVVGEFLSGVYRSYCDNRADVWVMKVYGVQDSWTKLVSVQNLEFYMTPSICFANDEKILFECEWKMVLYDVKTGTLSEIKNCDGCFKACTIVESLVSPMSQEGGRNDED